MHSKIVTTKNRSNVACKVSHFKQKAATAASVAAAYAMCGINALAVNIDTNYKLKDPGTNFNPEGMILGLAFWIARLVGIGMLVWGIYGYVTARKDGEAESMNGAIGKLISGVVLIAMPSVMTGLGLI